MEEFKKLTEKLQKYLKEDENLRDFELYNKLTEYMLMIGYEEDVLPEDCTLQELINWIFIHNKEAYHKDFWIHTFNMTEEELDRYEISADLEDDEEE